MPAFDLVNNILALSVGYAVAARANPTREAGGLALWHVLRTPSPYAILVGLLLNLGGRDLPAGLERAADGFAIASPFLIAVGTGILFAPIGGYLRRAATLAATRLLVGVSVALILVLVLGLDGVDRGVVLLVGVAPLGFVIVTYASLENLDVELAAQTLALARRELHAFDGRQRCHRLSSSCAGRGPADEESEARKHDQLRSGRCATGQAYVRSAYR